MPMPISSGLKPEQVEHIKLIVDAFNAKNQLDQLTSDRVNSKIQNFLDTLTDNPIKVNTFLTREEIYDR